MYASVCVCVLGAYTPSATFWERDRHIRFPFVAVDSCRDIVFAYRWVRVISCVGLRGCMLHVLLARRDQSKFHFACVGCHLVDAGMYATYIHAW